MTHIAFVTGSAAGIGEAIARAFAVSGERVVIADIDVDRGKALAAELGQEAMFVRVDVTKRGDWERAHQAVSDRWGEVDILVNNAGMFRDKTLMKMSDSEWDVVLDVNLKSVWIGMQTMIPGMKTKGWGRIVNVSSSAYRGSFGQANYSAAKGGLISLTRTAAIEALRGGVLINAIAPHNVNTSILQSVPDELRADWLSKSRFGRFLEPSEIAEVVAFLASDRNRVVTGQLIEIDGGDLVGLP